MTTMAESLAFRVGGDASPLVQTMREAGQAAASAGTTAKTAWQGVDSSMKGLQAQTVKMTAATKKATHGFHQHTTTTQALALQMPDVISQLASGTNAFQIFTQQGLQIAQTQMGQLWAMGPLVIVALGGVAQAAGLGYVAWRIYNDETARNNRIMDTVIAAQTEAAPLAAALAQAMRDLAVATGDVTREQGKLTQASVKALATFQASTEETRKKLASLRVEQASLWTQMVDGAESVMPAWTPLGAAVRAMTTSSGELRMEEDALQGQLNTSIAILDKYSAAMRKTVTEEEKKKRATRAARTGRRDAEEAAREEAAALEKLAAIGENASIQKLSGEERLTAEYKKQLRIIQELATTEATRAAAAAATTQIQAKLEADLWAARNTDIEESQAALDEWAAKMDAAMDRLQADAEEKIETQQAMALATISATSSILGGMGDLIRMNAESGKSSKEAAEKQWAVAQGFAYASAVTSTAAGIARAIMDYPFPVSLAVGLEAGIAGAVQIARIATTEPSFSDTPTAQYMRSGGSVRLAPGDTFVAAKDTTELARQALNAAGRSVAPVPVVVNFDGYRHVAMGRGSRDALRSPGAAGEVNRMTSRTPGRR